MSNTQFDGLTSQPCSTGVFCGTCGAGATVQRHLQTIFVEVLVHGSKRIQAALQFDATFRL